MVTAKLCTLILCSLFLPRFSSFGQYSAHSFLRFDTVRVEGRVGLSIELNELPGQRFVLEIPEVFTLKENKNGLFNYNEQVWVYNKRGAEMKFEDEQYMYSIQLRKFKSGETIGVKWNISFRNKTNTSLYDLAAFNCWTMNAAPLFKDLTMDRTYVLDSSGNKVPLKSIRKVQGENRRSMQFYPSLNGIDLSGSPWISQWNVNSNQVLSGASVIVESTDANWIFLNEVKGKVAYFFNNWENDHGCVHASPLLASELKAGHTANAGGVFKFVRNRDK